MTESQLAQEAEAEGTPNSKLYTQSYTTVGERMISPTRSVPALPIMTDGNISEDRRSIDESRSKAADDSASLQSTSSKSFFRSPMSRKRVTDRSAASKGTQRTRRESDVRSEDSTGLGRELELELQKQGKDGGQWGIGDEARMSME